MVFSVGGKFQVGCMCLVIWNVNFICICVICIVEFVVCEDIDVLVMQEIKCKLEQFLYVLFEEVGYYVEVYGLNQWNGVVIVSCLFIIDVWILFDGMLGFVKGYEGLDVLFEVWVLGVMVDGVWVWSLYVLNGCLFDDLYYLYKLYWLEQLKNLIVVELLVNFEFLFVLVGDFNIILFDYDNGDFDIVVGCLMYVFLFECDVFFVFQDVGFIDVVCLLLFEGFMYWDYQCLKFLCNEGICIDFIFGLKMLVDVVIGVLIYWNECKGEQFSDYVFVVVDLDFGGVEVDDDFLMIFF